MLKVKDKERTFKIAGEKKCVTNEGTSIRLTADFSPGSLEARSQWYEIFKMLEEYQQAFYIQ